MTGSIRIVLALGLALALMLSVSVIAYAHGDDGAAVAQYHGHGSVHGWGGHGNTAAHSSDRGKPGEAEYDHGERHHHDD